MNVVSMELARLRHFLERALPRVLRVLVLAGALLMPAPTNVSALTATDLGTLPASVSQNVHDSGTTYTVWYSYTAVLNDVVIGLWGFGDLTTYRPTVTVWTGPASAPVAYLPLIASQNKPIQVPVVVGTTYYFKFTTNAGNPTPAVLLIEAETHVTQTVPSGSILVNDDTNGFPVALLSATANNTVLAFRQPFPAGEEGDVLSTGAMCIADKTNLTVVPYTPAFVPFASIAAVGVNPSDDIPIRAQRSAGVFYVGVTTNPVVAKVVSPTTGAVTSSETMTGITNMKCLAANNAQTILYHARATSGGAVRRWDLVGHAALSDLVAGVANYFVRDLLILADDSILAGYFKLSGGLDYNVLHYNAAGATLHTYAFGANVSANTTMPRLAYSVDNATTFWVWIHNPAGATSGVSHFQQVQVSNGALLVDRTFVEYETGIYEPAATATPVARFGPSFSCPFMILPIAATPPTATSYPIRRQRRFLLPSSERNYQMFLGTLELLMEGGHGLIEGQGSDPQVMLRFSRDGGKTWGTELWRSGGAQGAWNTRVRWNRMGQYRNGVVEITVSDPVNWKFVAMIAHSLEEGSS